MLDAKQAPRPNRLTPDELEIASLVGQGYWGTQIADRLRLDAASVSERICSTLEKLDLDGRLDLWMYSRLWLTNPDAG